GAPARAAGGWKRASMSCEGATPATMPARSARGREAAPAPQPTSSTVPSGGSASYALAFDTVGGPSEASARLANSSTGKDQGDSGAAARMSSGMAHAARASFHRSPAVERALIAGP